MLRVKKYRRIVKQIYQVLPTYQAMSDIELQKQTQVFKQALATGQRIEHILPAVFAVVIEADRRVLGMEPYEVQILGGVALFYGNIAELKTGEGKTLVATMPLYARALLGNKGNFLITANDYLADRDGHDMGRVYQWLGLTVGIGVSNMDEAEEKVLYTSDIIYSTHSKLGFDYLFDNLGSDIANKMVTRFNFAIIDEIDSVLLDGAQTALVISGAPKVQSNFFQISQWFINGLTPDDYELSDDELKVWFTKDGLDKIRNYFDIEKILSAKYFNLYRHLILALQAKYLKQRGRDYVVEDGKVVLLDEVNGRAMQGVKLSGGIHQAIEAKEGVEITTESKTLGTISYQSLFKKFKRLSGMTGTAKTDEKEFIDTYHLEVIQIPTNEPVRRIDLPDQIYLDNQSKLESSLKLVEAGINDNRPVLIETGSVTLSNLYSLLLLKHGIPHNLLNATTAAREKEIIKEAGTSISVTLATSMAGRGTDIKLTDTAKANGGLLVVGTERMTSKRIDNQLRGRAGRQGEPGSSQFFVSLEDKVIVENSTDRIRKYRNRLLKRAESGKVAFTKQLTSFRAKRLMDKAQKRAENKQEEGRKTTLAFELVLGGQRDKIYQARDKVLAENQKYLDEIIADTQYKVVGPFIGKRKEIGLHEIADFIFNNMDSQYQMKDLEQALDNDYSSKNVQHFLTTMAGELLEAALNRFKSEKQLAHFKKLVILKSIDMGWIDQLDYLQQLRAVVDGRGTAQRKPINEFGREARRSFFEMEDQIWLNIFKNIVLTEIEKKPDGSINLIFP
ncbi:preprotein translocase subunit SecA [Weissella oryzae SG25]|uniref:Protein translocase subunit SecA n=1 Tax=Weissella oryzae (strain DSM 25784 / JCM 18191 / LMG 30913 / SG25) TaxID=1329250 RepID=A0A069CUM3_WEIOS|nr:preprotein translocase subunit SecA [Weissella oryzae]GAK31179.1 preprotein translocase subunit SecA [Weissella oryzae SG25]